MTATPDIVVKFKVDAGPFIRAMHDATYAIGGLAYAYNRQPRPPRKPYPKRYSRMSARQYRAARRAYARAVRAHRKATP